MDHSQTIILVGNSNICVSFSLLGCFPHYGSYFSASLHAWYFLLDARYCRFYFVGARYYSISINMLELRSGTQLSYWEPVWSFQLSLLGFVMWGKLVLTPEVRPSEYSASPVLWELWNSWEFHSDSGLGIWLMEALHYSRPAWVVGTVSSNPFQWFFT